MALDDSILSLANNALKQNPELVTKLLTNAMSNSNVDLLKKLAENPIFTGIAKQLVTTEAFQQFIMKLATSEIGKTIIVNGAQFVVTQQMQNGLGGVLSSVIPGLLGNANANPNAGANTNATASAAANIGGQVAMSLLNQFLNSKK